MPVWIFPVAIVVMAYLFIYLPLRRDEREREKDAAQKIERELDLLGKYLGWVAEVDGLIARAKGGETAYVVAYCDADGRQVAVSQPMSWEAALREQSEAAYCIWAGQEEYYSPPGWPEVRCASSGQVVGVATETRRGLGGTGYLFYPVPEGAPGIPDFWSLSAGARKEAVRRGMVPPEPLMRAVSIKV